MKIFFFIFLILLLILLNLGNKENFKNNNLNQNKNYINPKCDSEKINAKNLLDNNINNNIYLDLKKSKNITLYQDIPNLNLTKCDENKSNIQSTNYSVRQFIQKNEGKLIKDIYNEMTNYLC